MLSTLFRPRSRLARHTLQRPICLQGVNPARAAHHDSAARVPPFSLESPAQRDEFDSERLPNKAEEPSEVSEWDRLPDDHRYPVGMTDLAEAYEVSFGRASIDDLKALDNANYSETEGLVLQDLGFPVDWNNKKYAITMSEVCEAGDLKRILPWHRVLTKAGNGPQSPQDIFQPRQHLLRNKEWAAAWQIKRDFKPKALLLNSPTSLSALEEQPNRSGGRSLQDFVSHMDATIGVSKWSSVIDDHKCSRLFANSWLPVAIVLDSLYLMNITEIGSLTMREIIKRTVTGQTCNVFKARQFILKMQDLKMSLPTGFGMLILHCIEQGDADFLYHLATTTIDPDLYADLNMHEQMLHSTNTEAVKGSRMMLQYLIMSGRVNQAEARNVLFRAGFDDIERMLADNCPITRESREFLIQDSYLDRDPWISDTKALRLVRIFPRIQHVGVYQWRDIIKIVCYIPRAHFRKDFEAMLLSISQKDVFDHRTQTEIIKWYLTLGTFAESPRLEVLLGGLKILAKVRDQGLSLNVQKACEANLMSVFGSARLMDSSAIKKRTTIKKTWTIEEFIVAMQKIWGPELWPSMSVEEIVLKMHVTRDQKMWEKREKFGASNMPHTADIYYNLGLRHALWKKIGNDQAESIS